MDEKVNRDIEFLTMTTTEAMEACGFATKAELAEFLEIDKSAPSQWENDQVPPRHVRRILEHAAELRNSRSGSGRAVGDLPIYVERMFNLTPDYYASLSAEQRRDLIEMMRLSIGQAPAASPNASNPKKGKRRQHG